MAALRIFRTLPTLILATAWLGAGCAPEPDDGDDAAPVIAERVDPGVAPSDDRPSTHPLPPIQEVQGPSADEPVVYQDASGKTDACGDVPAELTKDNTARRASGSGYAEYTTNLQNLLTRLQTKMTVPAKPPPSGTVFLWPGVQPIRGPNWSPVVNGVLQPVLTWGPSCAPGSQGIGYSTWWISAVYVNVSTTLSTHRNCHGGKVLKVNTGDVLDLDIVQKGTAWTQIIKNLSNGEQAEYTIDLKGQEQGRAIFDIELPTRTKPVGDLLFTETVLTYANPRTTACVPSTQGTNDYISKARLSADKTKCCIDRIALRAAGVAASTQP